MKNLNCPDCDSKIIKSSEKIRIAFIGGSIKCSSCGANIVARGRTLAIGTVMGNFIPIISALERQAKLDASCRV